MTCVLINFLPKIAITISSLTISIEPRAMKYSETITSPWWTRVSPGGAWVVLNFIESALKCLEYIFSIVYNISFRLFFNIILNHTYYQNVGLFTWDNPKMHLQMLDNYWANFCSNERICQLVDNPETPLVPYSCQYHLYRSTHALETRKRNLVCIILNQTSKPNIKFD